MITTDKIYIAGHNGLVGSSIVRRLNNLGYTNLLMMDHNELDLINQKDVADFFNDNRPDYVILSAAKVGGIHANSIYPADFIYENLMIAANIIHSSYLNQVKKLIFLGSTCVYPRVVEQPMREDALLTGRLEPTNEPYAVSKIAGIKLCESYNRQYGTDFRSLMPTNIFGVHDNFNQENSHVIPSLMRRMHDAKVCGKPEVMVWGTGNAMREFMYVDDLADAVIFMLELEKSIYHKNTETMLSHINVGTGVDVKISELATMLKQVVGYKGAIVFDVSKQDGAPRKLIDVSKLNAMGWKPVVSLYDGLIKTYEWYKLYK